MNRKLFMALLLLEGAAFGHSAGEHSSSQPWHLLWTWEPITSALLALTASLYVRGSRVMTVKPKGWQQASFWFGWLTLLFALVSPIHKLGSQLFSIHMGQHELLMLVAAPLLVMSKPLVPSLWALPSSWRVRAGAISKRPWFAKSWRVMTGAIAVFVIHAMALWIWHVPLLFEAAMQSELIHAIQHMCFFLTAILFWWALINGRYGRMGYGVAVFFVWATALHTSLLGALLTFSNRVWYPLYGTNAPGTDVLADQQLAGLIMWVPAAVIFIIVGLALFAAWLGEAEKRAALSTTEAISKSV